MSLKDPYAILSVCSTLGTLHIHHPQESVPRLSQTSCRLRNPQAITIDPTSTIIIASCENPSASSTSLTTFSTHRTSGGPHSKTTAPEPYISSTALSSDGAFLAAGGETGRCYIWCATTGDLFLKFDAHFQPVTSLSFTHDDELLLTVGADASIHAYSVADLVDISRDDRNPPVPKLSLLAHSLPISQISVGFGAASARLLSVSADRTARIWHIGSATCVSTILLPCAATAAALSVDESLAYIGVQDGSVFVADIASLPITSVSYKSLLCISPPVQPGLAVPSVTSLSLSPLCTQIVVGYSDGMIRIYHCASRQLLHTYGKHSTTAPITCVRTVYPVPVLRDGEDGRLGSGDVPVPPPSDVMFGKMRDPELLTKYTPLVFLNGPRTTREAAWGAIDVATKMAFADLKEEEEGARIRLPDTSLPC